MKHSRFRKPMAFLLALMLCVTMVSPAFAAKIKLPSSSSSSSYSWSWSDLWNKIFGKGKDNTPADTDTSDDTSDLELTLIEDETTVAEGTQLRASTYALSDNGATTLSDSDTTLKYFPVTMYNYDKTTINNATHQVEVDGGLGNTWNGIYFNDGNPSAESYTYSTGGEVSYTSTTVDYSNNNNYNTYINNGYYVDVNGTKYLVTGLSCTRSGSWWNGYTYSWTITYAGGTATSSDSSITLYKASTGSTATTASLSYADWNFWNKKSGNNDNGQKLYTGLVEPTLTANKDITFTKPDGGIFNSDATVKDIYTGVEMPFVYENGTYTFDASQNGVYFHSDSTQGSTAAQSNGRLYFNEGKPQSNGGSYGDGSTTVWMPFNSTQSISGEANCDYHFGMRTTIPFTMTANGRLNPNDDESTPINFSFSGDDDVWVFIDGQLVIDLGGIHNRLDATIDFAANTITYGESNTSTVEVGSYNDSSFQTTQTLFGGAINQNRETFAATDSHELTIFYLERGAGSSNCKIQFNLPMKDTVSVQKLVNEKDSEGVALDAETLAQINARDFGFTLYKDGTPVANTNYSLLNENGQYITTASTDANGHFTLKNKQTAKFVGTISTDGNTYYAVEDKDADADAFWEEPTWTYTADPAASAEEQKTNVSAGESMRVKVTGSDEGEDHLSFVCKNLWVHQDKTSINAVDDKIVIDYGLPVEIDVLANDVVSNGTKSIEGVTGAEYGTAAIENGKIKYQLTKQLTGVEVLNYTVKATATSGVEDDNKTATAKVYIIPATTMYYEENFAGLVTFSDGWSDVGTAQTDPQEPGVVGTVGDSPYGSDAAYLNDSGDSNGSSKYVNTTDGAASFSYTFTGTGTSFFARTTNNSGYMRVVITNTDGKTVYTGYRDTSYKNTEGTIGGDINVTGGILYNIPVFTYEADDYGTYKVTVTIAGGANAKNYGKEFWLDGIRVVKPLNADDTNASVANSAYATDGEANMTVETLRQKLLVEYTTEDENGNMVWDGVNFVVFTDTNGEIQLASEYKSNGPKEEVYLNKGQSVTFSLYDWDANTNKIYLGMKAPTGSGSVSINGNPLNINNAADCYYDISGYADITTDEDGVKIATFKVEATSSLISVTNIKVTGNAEFTIVDQDDIISDDSEIIVD
ncbi:fibro-slime domain-containing protein [Butyricicoccus sp.]|uniref:fibro-slime domain-containing protein n=1 Tax=Butyricicoccus sp. TaxID=2049021 RepID=UPI003F189207